VPGEESTLPGIFVFHVFYGYSIICATLYNVRPVATRPLEMQQRMKLETSIFVSRKPEKVWAYLGNASNVAAWDRGVSRTEAKSASVPGVGFEFVTLAHPRRKSKDGAWGKMSYRITETDAVNGCAVQLTSDSGNTRFFKSAEWRFRVEAEPQGSRVWCTATFALKWLYLPLAPLFLSMKKAIHRDLVSLKEALENGDRAD